MDREVEVIHLVLVSVVGSSTGIFASASGGSASGQRPEAAGLGLQCRRGGKAEVVELEGGTVVT
eukprot:2023054-Rhodomonas_salina.1